MNRTKEDIEADIDYWTNEEWYAHLTIIALEDELLDEEE